MQFSFICLSVLAVVATTAAVHEAAVERLLRNSLESRQEGDLWNIYITFYAPRGKAQKFLWTEDLPAMDTSLHNTIVVPSFKRPNGIADAIAKKKEGNVFVVDWSSMIPKDTQNYTEITQGAEVAAIFVAHLINSIRAAKSPGSNSVPVVHVIGDFIGAHIAGIASEFVDAPIDRITGLDPAGPHYNEVDVTERLDASDATLVDVIHTNGGSFETDGSLGYEGRLGHVDFLVNGGAKQPKCNPGAPTQEHLRKALENGDWLSLSDCSSTRAAVLYIKAVKSKHDVVGYVCESYPKFVNGECLDEDENFFGPKSTLLYPGEFYMLTSDRNPYLVYHVGVEAEANMDVTGKQISIKVKGRGFKTIKKPIIGDRDTGTYISDMFVVPAGYDINKLKVRLRKEGPEERTFGLIVFAIRINIKLIRITLRLVRCAIWLLTSFSVISLITFSSPCSPFTIILG